jgi:hypothetical protein
MRLPVPGPRDLLAVLEKGADQVEALLGAVPRVLTLLDQAEVLLVRASAAVDQVEAVTRDAAVVVVHTNAVVDRAEVLVGDTDALARRLATLLELVEGPMTTLEPTLRTLADTTHPEEVAALVQLIDHLPELTDRVETDVLPVLSTLGTVAPDIHDLLEVSRELNDMLAKLPGMGRIKRRIDEQQGEDATTATVRDD